MTESRSLPLARKLPLLVLGLLLGVLAITLGVSYYEIRRSAELSAGERLSALTHVLTNLLEQQVGNRAALERRVGRDSAVQNALRNPTRPVSPAAAKALSSMVVTAADSAAPPELWTPDGHTVGAIGLELPADRQHAREELLASRPATDSTRVGRIGFTDGRAGFYVAVPVHDSENRLLGYVAQLRRLVASPRSLQPVRDLIGSDIEVSLRNRDDQLWVQLSGARVPPPRDSTATLDGLTLLDRAKGNSLSATLPIAGTPMLVTVERPISQIFARPLAAIRALAIIAVVLAVLGALVAWLISRRLVQPLNELTDAAESIARGNYERRVKVQARDEVGRLGAAFNRMAEEVQVSSDASTNALARLTRAMETQEFLAEASRILAGSLSDETILGDLARYCVPKLGDYCTIHVAGEDGTIRRVETAHRDPAKLDKVRELARHVTHRLDGPGEVSEVIRSQRPILVPHVDLESLRTRVGNPRFAQLLDEIGPESFICVPLIARGRAFGAMSLTIAGSHRQFTDEDLEIAMELARRASGAIDNAVIYHRSVVLRLEAEAASNAKSEFLAKMSHEIRTPINAMMGYAELIQMGISGPTTEAQSKQLARILASGEHLTMLVNEILDLAKIEAGQMDVQSGVAPAREAIDTALTLVRPLASRKGVEIAAAPHADGDVQYVGDPQRVQQIVTNLLSNAVKFTHAGGSVSVSCSVGRRAEDERDWACIRVEDTGVGIQAEDAERIFQPFVQVDSGYTRSQGGTGLGLTISRSLAQLMGGEITLESQPGVGSAFTLWLPCPNRAQAIA